LDDRWENSDKGLYEAETIFCASLAEPLNGRRYARFLAEDLSDLLDDVPLAVLNDMWFQQDGAPAHGCKGKGCKSGARSNVSWSMDWEGWPSRLAS